MKSATMRGKFHHLRSTRNKFSNNYGGVEKTAQQSNGGKANCHSFRLLTLGEDDLDLPDWSHGDERRRNIDDDARYQRRSHHHQHRRRRYHRHLYQRHLIELPKLEFSQTEYKAEVREDIPIQTSILQVRVSSSPVLDTSDMEIRVNDDNNFGIDSSGVLYNKRPLDYEQTKGYYLLKINAEYKGDHRNNPFGERITGKATARIYIIDTPEPPRFESEHYFFSVPELASTGAYVGTVKAVDDDNDLDAYILQDVRPPDMFTIDQETGIIRVGRILTSDKQWAYNFQVGAIDFAGHVTIAPVTVYLIATNPSYDENNHKPVFMECDAYDGIHVKENMTEGTPVLMVLATDEDPGNNGVVSYVLLNDFGRFTIQSSNQQGQISTTKRLDRDGEDKEFYLTVVARDGGSEPHQDSCSFKVVVEDINDNPPIFDQQIYEETISTDHITGTPVLRVTASDLDSGSNAEISFSLQGNPDDMKYFAIDGDTGIISLTSPLQKSMASCIIFTLVWIYISEKERMAN